MKFKTTILLIFIIGLFTSCEDIIDVKLSEDDLELYAVEAKITTNDNPSVYLYKSQKVNADNPYVGVSNATVLVSDNSTPPQSITLKESTKNKGLYIPEEGSSYFGETGKIYRIKITVGDMEMTALDTLARVEPIDSIQVRPSLRGDKLFLGIFTYGNEPPELGNYYKWDVFINNELLHETEYIVIASDELVNGNYISGFEIFTDFHDPNQPEDRKINLGDTLLVKQTSISKFVYYFYYQMFNQAQTGGFFSVPPANIKSNFSANNKKEVFGLFTASDVSVSNMIIVDEEIENELKK